MAHQIGTASDWRDLLEKLEAFITQRNVVSAASFASTNVGDGTLSSGPTQNDGSAGDALNLVETVTVTVIDNIGDPTYPSTNSGDGTVGSLSVDSESPVETWMLEVIDDTYEGAEIWSVTGSISGAQNNAATGVAYNDIVQFLIAAGSSSAPWAVGDQIIFVAGAEEWTVVGDVHGAESNAFTGVAYDDRYQFTIAAGTTVFDIGDFFTFNVTRYMGTNNLWTKQSDGTAGGTQDGRKVFNGVGLGGTDDIWFQLRNDSDVSTNKYNWECSMFVDFTDPSSGYQFQLGSQPSSNDGLPTLFLDNNPMNYVFHADGATVIVVAQVGTIFETGYYGFYERIAPPSANPYPLFVGAMGGESENNFQIVGDDHSWFLETTKDDLNNSHKSNAFLRSPGGVWHKHVRWFSGTVANWGSGINANGNTFWTSVSMIPYGHYLQKDFSNDYPMLPIDLWVNNGQGEQEMVGSLRNIRWTTGLGLTAGDITTDNNGDRWYVIQNAYRVGLKDFAMIPLD